MSHAIFQVDAFTEEPFKGNPACVCLLTEPAEAGWMQNVAAEMNLSETAFIWQEGDDFRLRWFTPVIEVELCGHATLAASHILWELGVLAQNQEARFQTLSGLLTAGCDDKGWIELNFPARPFLTQTPEWIDKAADSLGVKPMGLGISKEDVLIELKDETAVRELEPDFAALKALPARGIIVTSRSGDWRFDFVSRFFAPAVGIDEDPVTGSAHCVLAPYWAKRLNKTSFWALQVSARGGILRVRMDGDRVRIAGRAVTILRGELKT